MDLQNMLKVGDDYVDTDTGEIMEQNFEYEELSYPDPDTGEIKTIRIKKEK